MEKAECKKLGGEYDDLTKSCGLPVGKMLLVLGISIILLTIGMFVIGGLTLYTATAVFNLWTFTWTGAFLIGALVVMYVWIYVKAKKMANEQSKKLTK